MQTYADVRCRTLSYAGEIVLVICEDKGDVAAFKDFVPAGPRLKKIKNKNHKKNKILSVRMLLYVSSYDYICVLKLLMWLP